MFRAWRFLLAPARFSSLPCPRNDTWRIFVRIFACLSPPILPRHGSRFSSARLVPRGPAPPRRKPELELRFQVVEDSASRFLSFVSAKSGYRRSRTGFVPKLTHCLYLPCEFPLAAAPRHEYKRATGKRYRFLLCTSMSFVLLTLANRCANYGS